MSIERQSKPDFSLYPNPVSRSAHIVSGCIIDFLEVTDIYGKVRLSIHPGSIAYDLNISDFKPGTYFLRIVSDGNSRMTRLIKD